MKVDEKTEKRERENLINFLNSNIEAEKKLVEKMKSVLVSFDVKVKKKELQIEELELRLNNIKDSVHSLAQ